MQKNPNPIPNGDQFAIHVLQNLCSEAVGEWDFVVLVEDFDAGGPSSIIVRMEYLISIKFGVVNIFVENKGGGGRKHYFGIFCRLRVL